MSKTRIIVAAMVLSLATHALADFVEDSQWTVTNRVSIDHRKYPDVAGDNKARQAGFGLLSEFKSGYTEGTVGVGFDAHAYLGAKLEQTGLNTNIGINSKKADGSFRDNYSKISGAAKVKLFDTEIKYGDMRLANPMFYTTDSRLLPETARAFYVKNTTLDFLTIEAGRVRGSSSRSSNLNFDDLLVIYANPEYTKGKHFDFVGGSWDFGKITANTYYGKYDNSWKSLYLDAGLNVPVTEVNSIDLFANIYDSKDYGSSHLGKVDARLWSTSATFNTKQQSFTLAYQKNSGTTVYDYIGVDSIYSVNAMQLSDFSAPGEKSWRVGYSLDLSNLVTDGLSFHANYVRGSGIKAHKNEGAYTWLGYGDGGKHWERNILVKYTMPSGKLKGLDVALRFNTHRANDAQAEGDMDNFRLIVSFPIGG